MTNHDEEIVHRITKTCFPHPWSYREVSCEENYMEAQEAATSVWQIMFVRQGKGPVVLSVHEAQDLGYFFDVTVGRIVFRTAYGQEYSVTDMTLTVMAPMVSAHSGFKSKDIGIGVKGRRLDPDVAAERGFTLDVGPETVEISIPYAAEGGFRKSFVMDNTYHEFYGVCLYYEHIFTTDNDTLESRLHYIKPMTTPVISHTPYTTNLTVLEERVFTVYVGDFPFDVELVSVSLNGKDMTVSEATQSGYQISKILHDDAHAYTIRVPFEDPVVSKVYFVEGVLEYTLDINYILRILLQEDEYFHFTTVVAHVMDVYPPYFNGLCMDNGIKFRIDHQEFDHMWEPGVGPYPLTQELADTRGYIMTNNSQSLTLEVPLFTIGYKYENVSLEQFFATFEILIRDATSLEVVQSSGKICRFPTTEMLVCSPEGVVTVVTDLTKAKPGALPSKTTLLDKTCKPNEADETRILFKFTLNSCGTRVQVANDFVTYENEILLETLTPEDKPVITRDSPYRVILRCVYPVHGVNRLFIDRRFQPATPGKGAMTIQKPLKSLVTGKGYIA
ncbi:uncharacterized protein LOC143127075 [Alosa pseudoharengus]|uniref:uncharacterized protein LOC143127075 n=1 Tax=Alosa pseudoharengus TaxID=34774 RepID=UPI003F89206B